jgi:hypothetical protein
VVFLVVARFAHVDLFVLREVAWPALVVPRHEHDEASIHNLVNTMVSILACFDYLVLQKMPVEAMHCLLRSVVPTCVHPLSAVRILPRAIDLSNNRLREVVCVLNVHPVANLPEFTVV